MVEQLNAVSSGLIETPRRAPFDLAEDRVGELDFKRDLDYLDDEDQLQGSLEEDDFSINSPISLYLREIARSPLLTKDEEVDLAKTREAGEEAKISLAEGVSEYSERGRLEEIVRQGKIAHDRLYESNLRLVVSVARKYTGKGLPFLDLIQEGNTGLNRGVEKYDWRRGFRFSTYAYWWVRQAVSRAISDQARTIRLPVHIIEKTSRIRKTAHEVYIESGHEPTQEEIAERLGINPEKVKQALQAAKPPISLEMPIGDDEESVTMRELYDVIADPQKAFTEDIEETDVGDHLRRVLNQLEERERKVLMMRNGLTDIKNKDGQYIEIEPKTLGEIGEILGISRERVRQIEVEAKRKLRKDMQFIKEFRDMVD